MANKRVQPWACPEEFPSYYLENNLLFEQIRG
jgi:hypothetical protein